MKKHLSSVLCVGLLLCALTSTALAAEAELPTGAEDTPLLLPEEQMPQPVGVYPAEVRASEENGVYRLEKVYCLTASDDPATIPTADFDREGRSYTLLDLLKTDQSETDSKEHTEVLTLNTQTKDMTEILKLLEPTLEVTTEDGYAGVLSLDHTSIAVEAAGYNSRSYDVSASRTYPNLSDADTSLIPKSVEENGRTLTLADISWQSAASDQMDGYDLALRYTAVATYTGTATSKYATGYIVTADYTGEVTKTTSDVVLYTAVFSSTGKAAKGSADGLLADVGAGSTDGGFDFRWLTLPAILLILAGGGYFGYKGYKRYQNKKRGYE